MHFETITPCGLCLWATESRFSDAVSVIVLHARSNGASLAEASTAQHTASAHVMLHPVFNSAASCSNVLLFTNSLSIG